MGVDVVSLYEEISIMGIGTVDIFAHNFWVVLELCGYVVGGAVLLISTAYALKFMWEGAVKNFVEGLAEGTRNAVEEGWSAGWVPPSQEKPKPWVPNGLFTSDPEYQTSNAHEDEEFTVQKSELIMPKQLSHR